MAATPQQRQEFGQLLRSLRESKGLSQRRLAQAVSDLGAEVTDRSVSGWERGAFAPDRRFLLLLEPTPEPFVPRSAPAPWLPAAPVMPKAPDPGDLPGQ